MLERYFSFWISFTTNIKYILILLYRFYTLYNFFCSLNAIIPCVLAAAEVGDFFCFRFFRYCFSVFIFFGLGGFLYILNYVFELQCSVACDARNANYFSCTLVFLFSICYV